MTRDLTWHDLPNLPTQHTHTFPSLPFPFFLPSLPDLPDLTRADLTFNLAQGGGKHDHFPRCELVMGGFNGRGDGWAAAGVIVW